MLTRAVLPAFVLLAGSCTTTRAIRNASTDVSATAQKIGGAADSMKAIADTIGRHVVQTPAPLIDGTTKPQTPLDVLLQFGPTVTVDVFAAAHAIEAAWKALREVRAQKAEAAP